MAQLVITIQTDSAAFSDDDDGQAYVGREVARILRDYATAIAAESNDLGSVIIRDTNGKIVGSAVYHE